MFWATQYPKLSIDHLLEYIYKEKWYDPNKYPTAHRMRNSRKEHQTRADCGHSLWSPCPQAHLISLPFLRSFSFLCACRIDFIMHLLIVHTVTWLLIRFWYHSSFDCFHILISATRLIVMCANMIRGYFASSFLALAHAWEVVIKQLLLTFL